MSFRLEKTLILCTLIALGALSHTFGHAQSGSVLEQVAQQTADGDAQDTNSSSPDDDQTTASDNGNEEAPKQSPDVNFSDAIPVDTILDTWEKQYQEFLEALGLGNSLHAKLAVSGLIVLILLIGFFVSQKLTRAIQRKLYAAAKRFHVSEGKIDFYHSLVYWFFAVILLICAFSALIVTWEINLNSFVSDAFISSALANIFTIYIIVFIAAIAMDILCGLIETSFHHWSSASKSRVDTLLPIARNTVYIAVTTIFTLMLLAEIGINVMPLLAGAGVLGFAIGFGAQTIIKDLLTGFIIILEDLIQVGDVVTLAGCTGMIEKITIRKVQLRTLDGTVYTVPFGEIAIVGNLTKEFSYAMFEVGIAYRENVDAVSDLLLKIEKEMREDEKYADNILEPLEILGLDKFADSAVVIKARLKTQPLSQWSVGREFNRRMKKLFDEENIEIPFPHQTIYFGEDKDGKAPPLRLKEINGGESAEDKASSAQKDKPQEEQADDIPKNEKHSGEGKAKSLPDNDDGDDAED